MSAEAPLPRAYGFRYMRGFEPLLHAIAQAVRSLEKDNVRFQLPISLTQ